MVLHRSRWISKASTLCSSFPGWPPHPSQHPLFTLSPLHSAPPGSTWQFNKYLAGARQGLFMGEGSRTRGNGSVSEMTQPILGELWITALPIWLLSCLILSLFSLCACFPIGHERTPCVLHQTCFRVKIVFDHQPIFLSSFPHVCPCFTFAQSGASGLTFLCCRAAVRQGWKFLSFSPHKACCGQRLAPVESIQPL